MAEPRRYPFQPLLDLLAERGVTSPRGAGEALGLSGKSFKAAVEMGLIVKAADRYASRAGVHPAVVWPSWFDDALEDLGRDCPECSSRFLPNRSNQRYCRRSCADRAKWRRYDRRRRESPEYRLKDAARAKAWREGLSPAAVRAQRAKAAQRARAASEEAKAKARATNARWMRERYQNDPEYRARRLAAVTARQPLVTERYRTDPEFAERRRAQKRASMARTRARRRADAAA